MVEASISEAPGIIDLLVEAYYTCHIVFSEVGEIGLWSMEGIA